MNSEKLKELMQNEEFTNKIVQLNAKEDIQKVFKENGLDISLEELEELESQGKKALEDGELENVSGGVETEPAGKNELVGSASYSRTPGFWSGVGSGMKEAGAMFIKGPTLMLTGKDAYEKLAGVGYTGGAAIILGGLFVAGIGKGIIEYRKHEKKKNKQDSQ